MLASLSRSLVLATLLAACGGSSSEFDDSACLEVDPAEACPSPEYAGPMLVGSSTCDDPPEAMEVAEIGDLLTDEVTTRQGGNTLLGTEDTGAPEEVRECCYEARYEPSGGTCTI